MTKFSLATDHPIAIDSRDHTHPGGTMMDNSRNHRFNDIVYRLFPKKPLFLMDLGCAGGGFVKDCIDDGHEAVGVEGSDYSLLRKRAEWATIPGNLFTADITKPFQVFIEDESQLPRIPDFAFFDVVTAWEVMEHIKEEDLPGLCTNVKKHLAEGGVWVMSVSRQHGEHHVCVHDEPWWLKVMGANGLVNRPDLLANFTLQDWVRGPLQNAPDSFHLIVSRKGEEHSCEF